LFSYAALKVKRSKREDELFSSNKQKNNCFRKFSIILGGGGVTVKKLPKKVLYHNAKFGGNMSQCGHVQRTTNIHASS
jgi:hypothetical protein